MPINRLPSGAPFVPPAVSSHDAAAPAAGTAPAPAMPSSSTPAMPPRRHSARLVQAQVARDKAGKAARPDSTGAIAAPSGGWETTRLNTAQRLHVPVEHVVQIDLTGPGEPLVSVLTVRHPDQAFIESGKQVYNPALDRIFPIRDPANPEQVHPDYADPAKPQRCAPQVGVASARFYQDRSGHAGEETLWLYARRNFVGTKFSSKEDFLDAMRESCMDELRGTLGEEGEPPSCSRVKVETITSAAQCDSAHEFAALKGQYGCFPADYTPDGQPSLRNGRIVALFAGARLGSEQEDDAYAGLLGPEFSQRALFDYAANVRKRGTRDDVTWAPYGGGNVAQYINSTFKPAQDGVLVCDSDLVNALMVPVTFTLTDRNGKARQESMIAVVQHRPVAPGKQLKVDYGAKYTLPPPAEATTAAPMVIKVDPGESARPGETAAKRPDEPVPRIKPEPLDEDVDMANLPPLDSPHTPDALRKRLPDSGSMPAPKRRKQEAAPGANPRRLPSRSARAEALRALLRAESEEPDDDAGMPGVPVQAGSSRPRKAAAGSSTPAAEPSRRERGRAPAVASSPHGPDGSNPVEEAPATPIDGLVLESDRKFVRRLHDGVWAAAVELAAQETLPIGVFQGERPGRMPRYTATCVGRRFASYSVLPGKRDDLTAKTMAIAAKLDRERETADQARAEDAAAIAQFPADLWEEAQELAGRDTLPEGVWHDNRPDRPGSSYRAYIGRTKLGSFAVLPDKRDALTARTMAIATRLEAERNAKRETAEQTRREDEALIAQFPPDLWEEAQQLARKKILPTGVLMKPPWNGLRSYYQAFRGHTLLKSFPVLPGMRDEFTAKALAIATRLAAESK